MVHIGRLLFLEPHEYRGHNEKEGRVRMRSWRVRTLRTQEVYGGVACDTGVCVGVACDTEVYVQEVVGKGKKNISGEVFFLKPQVTKNRGQRVDLRVRTFGHAFYLHRLAG